MGRRKLLKVRLLSGLVGWFPAQNVRQCTGLDQHCTCLAEDFEPKAAA